MIHSRSNLCLTQAAPGKQDAPDNPARVHSDLGTLHRPESQRRRKYCHMIANPYEQLARRIGPRRRHRGNWQQGRYLPARNDGRADERRSAILCEPENGSPIARKRPSDARNLLPLGRSLADLSSPISHPFPRIAHSEGKRADRCGRQIGSQASILRSEPARH
jgi:hypothetical protein